MRGRAPDGEGRAVATTTAAVRPLEVWGILNVTPDSFSDGGRFLDVSAAVEQGRRMMREGAAVIDVGGESSRPSGATYGAGAARVPVDEELARVIPVIEGLVAHGGDVSVDTVKPEVARAALRAGARRVNDVRCGASDALLDAVAEADAELVLMHTREDGRVDATTTGYGDVVGEVLDELAIAVDRAARRGVRRIVLDPGIGFAKTAAQSAILLGNLDALVRTGYPVMVGASRKSFIARLHDPSNEAPPPPDRRIGGSLAAVTAAALAGCRAARVHDVYESVQAARVAEAMRAGRAGSPEARA